MNRRDFLTIAASTAAAACLQPAIGFAQTTAPVLEIDSTPQFALSPWLYMQFMEPLGVTDSSVEASWDHAKNRWRPDLISITKELAPTLMRWGGLFSAYYRWREAVGPRAARQPMFNINWGGVETNQIGTAEFVDFCQQVRADPMMCVNFEAEGDKNWAVNARGEIRSGDAKEAADWVSYCNDPDNRERAAHGQKDPLPIKVWQLGNETSYSDRRFNQASAIAKTIEFATAMRKADPAIKLIGWGDSGWAPAMIERAGEHLQFIAFHHLYDPARGDPKSALRNNNFRKDPAATWDALMTGHLPHEKKLVEMRQQVGKLKFPLALTECHYSIPGRNRCEVLSTWGAGVSYARFLNVHERHGEILKIANIADFCGTRWQTNAIMIPTPAGKSFMMPVARVMSLYRKHTGTEFLNLKGVPDGLDITASRTGDDLFLHVVNTLRTEPKALAISIPGYKMRSGRMFTIAADPSFEVLSAEDDEKLKPKEAAIVAGAAMRIEPASVTAIEIRLEKA